MEAMMVVSLWRKSWSGLKKRCVLLPLRCATDERKSWAEKNTTLSKESMRRCWRNVLRNSQQDFFLDGESVECMRRRTLRCDVTSRIKTCTASQRQHTMRFFVACFLPCSSPLLSFPLSNYIITPLCNHIQVLSAGCFFYKHYCSVLLKWEFFIKMRASYLQPSSLQYSSFFKEGGSKAGSSHFNEKLSF